MHRLGRLAASTALIGMITIAACSDDGASTATTSTPPSTTAAPTTVAPPTTTAGPTTPQTTAAPTTAAPTTAGPTTTQGPVTLPPTTAGPSTVPAPDVAMLAYFLRGEEISPVRRSVPGDDEEPLAAALEALLEGPTADEIAAGYGTAIPAGTVLNSITLDGSLVAVDLSPEFGSGGGSASMFARLAEVVATATQEPGITQVSFLVDGEPLTVLGGEGITVKDPMTRADIEANTPIILLESPAPGDEVSSPVRVAGTSNTFEATYQVRVTASDGTVVFEQFGTASSGMGERGTFEMLVDLGDHRGPATVRVFEYSSEDNSEVNVQEALVTVV